MVRLVMMVMMVLMMKMMVTRVRPRTAIVKHQQVVT